MYAEGGATRTCEGRGSEEEEHVGPGGDDGGNAGSPAEEHEGGRRGGSCKWSEFVFKNAASLPSF